MSNAPAGWHPENSPIHRLILTLDVLAVGLHSYRQRSLGLRSTSAERDRDDWRDEYSVVLRAVFPRGPNISPAQAASSLADAAIAEFARTASPPEREIDAACQWIGEFIRILVPTDAPEGRDAEWLARYRQEGAHLERYFDVRYKLLRAVARAGRRIPDDIRGRQNLAASTPVPFEQLQAWLSEGDSHAAVAASNATPAAGLPRPPSTGERPDGPFEEGGWFGLWVDGTRHQFQQGERQSFRIICHMWPPEPGKEFTVSDVKRNVGSKARNPKWSTNAASNARIVLGRCGLTYAIHAVNNRQHFRWEALPTGIVDDQAENAGGESPLI
jgi:hypothetical protein